ncbi:UDP-glucose:Glycoprotein Glucosyltransferase [Necator americanus]|uniref:UDP-glucose:Glycoprotein Glucosyltransferase n=1 Tax=Necator americanus TaxID=51031 RepID=W2U060_NECAM|nr:UDP-glucose:Glycoprotein Glucosyltransferase [Necator americanus]ETN86721.1 UDP-glucose:Glycoprotein Glucosyltransferase [Necator americanus]
MKTSSSRVAAKKINVALDPDTNSHVTASRWFARFASGYERRSQRRCSLPSELNDDDAMNVANILPGQRALVANGIIVGPFDEAEEFLASDIELLEKIVETRGAAVISSHIKNWNIRTENGFSSDVVMRSFALISKYAVSRKRTWIVLGENEKSTVTLVAEDPNRPVVDVVVVVDPLSRTAQKLAHILDLLRKTINCDLKIVLNPKPKLSELPLKRFYRFVAAPELQFDKSGKVVATQARTKTSPTSFDKVGVEIMEKVYDTKGHLTVKWDKCVDGVISRIKMQKPLIIELFYSPSAWMIENVFAEVDLDNIRMELAPSNVFAYFSLEHILLEGHCFDEVSGSPPRGLQFVLGTRANPTEFDTIVMANLGYFQLKANPGAWLLQLRDGRSKDIYQLSNYGSIEESTNDSVRVLIGDRS